MMLAAVERELVETAEVDEESGCGSNISDTEGEGDMLRGGMYRGHWQLTEVGVRSIWIVVDLLYPFVNVQKGVDKTYD